MSDKISSFSGKYQYLSNFYNCSVIYDGIEYANSEAAYHAQKSDDRDVKTEFMFLNPSEAKRLGRRVKMRDGFEDIKVSIMQEVVACKFMQNPELLKALQDTGDAYLLEGNTWHDNFWGSCNCGRKSCSAPGKNMLGKVLMQIRETSLNNMELLTKINERNL